MKDFVNKLLRNYAVVIIIVSIAFITRNDTVLPVSLLYELLAILLLVELSKSLMKKILHHSNYFALEHLCGYIVAMIVFPSAWRIFGWHERVAIWSILLSITAVSVTVFLLELGKTKQDVAYINEQLKQRRDKKREHVK